MQDRQQRVESSQELLEVYNANPEDFHTRLETGDETWLHHWDPDTKKESMQWKHLAHPQISYPIISQQGNDHGVLGLQRDYINRLLHDNAPVHKSRVAQAAIRECKLEQLNHPYTVQTWPQVIIICFEI